LASGSNRRRQLLGLLNLSFSVQVPDVNESLVGNEKPIEYVARLARSKAQVIYKSLADSQTVLAADTIVSLDEEIIGKPENAQHAKRILQKLSSVEHDVITGLCLKYAGNNHQTEVLSKVKFRQLSNSEISSYCLTDEPYDKAGAYAIQGKAARFVEYISGSYTNIMGLPLLEVYMLLKRANL